MQGKLQTFVCDPLKQKPMDLMIPYSNIVANGKGLFNP